MVKTRCGMTFLITVVLALFAFGPVAEAALSNVGPTSAQTLFPLYYTDSNGLALELCLTPPDIGPPCFFDPVIPSIPLSVQTGFGAEAFWFLADSLINPAVSGGIDGLLVLAIEAAYGAGDPTPNDQISFARVRIRVDLPAGSPTGTYTVTHPYGVNTFDVTTIGTNSINFTSDVGIGAPGVFTGALNGAIGPFLRMDPNDPNYAAITAAFPGYIGDSATPVTVVGSPFNTNYFRIQGPPGSGIDVQSNLFTLMGKIFTGNVPTPLTVDRANYVRAAGAPPTGQVNVFATSAPFASLQVSGTGLPTTSLVGDGNGKFFAHIPLADASTLPPTVTVTANNSAVAPNNTQTQIGVDLTDLVTVTQADFDVSLGTLTIQATSSDAASPPALTAAGLGALTGGSLVVNTFAPPASVVVASSAKGADAKQVIVAASGGPGNAPPVANNDVAVTDEGVAVLIAVTANDTDSDGTINVSTVQIAGLPAHGTASVNPATGDVTYTPAPNYAGPDSFAYVVRDNIGAFSNAATVSVTVNGVNTAPVTVADGPVNTSIGAPVLINVLANDSDVDGTINPATVALVAGSIAPVGSGTVAINPTSGAVTFTPSAGFSGIATFQYTVADNLGAVSLPATVTVNVTGTAEVLRVLRAEFRLPAGPYDIRGSSTSIGATVTIRLGSTLTGPVIATAIVDAAGTWRFSGNSATLPGATRTISVQSTGGANVLGATLVVR